MRSTVSRHNKSTVRSNKAGSEYKGGNDEDESNDSDHLFKIDKALITHNGGVNVSMHQTNNSSRRHSRVRGQQIITKRATSRQSSKSKKQEE